MENGDFPQQVNLYKTKRKGMCDYLKNDLLVGMFGNCFFSLFFVFKNNFLFLRLNTCLAIQNGQKTKTVFKIQFVKETENMQKAVFSF